MFYKFNVELFNRPLFWQNKAKFPNDLNGEKVWPALTVFAFSADVAVRRDRLRTRPQCGNGRTSREVVCPLRQAGFAILQSGGLGNIPTNWSVAGTGDFNGDRMGDILWRDSTGNTAIWLMNGLQILQTGGLGNIPTTWSVAGTGDFNGDGNSDILWIDTSDDVAIWLMNGLSVLQAGGLAAASERAHSLATARVGCSFHDAFQPCELKKSSALFTGLTEDTVTGNGTGERASDHGSAKGTRAGAASVMAV
jgi:hypothetical protein